MKLLFALLAAGFIAVGPQFTHAASVNGQFYVPLNDWAGANGLKTAWLGHNKQVAAFNHSVRLVFTVDSHDAEVNGVHVTLSFPVASDHGNVLLAQFDLDKTIRPLLYPSRYITPSKIMTICLDPGHGGKDSGNHVFFHKEKTYTLLLAFELRDQLKAAGFNVVLTRANDSFVDLPERPAIANQRRADLFISLHFNYTMEGKDEVAGPETYCITPVGAASSNSQGEGADHGMEPANRVELRSLFLAWQVQKSLVQTLNVNDRAVRRARFAVLRDAMMPAILIEGGYMTNPAEARRIYSADWRKQMASAVVKAVLAYQRATAVMIPAQPVMHPGIHKAIPQQN